MVRTLNRPEKAAISVIALFAIASLALHGLVLAVTPFGIHRDEFLYFSMGNHLRLWHMDFPPAIAMLGALSQTIFGHTVAAARVFPAIEGTVLIVLAALFKRDGRRKVRAGIRRVRRTRFAALPTQLNAVP